MSMSNPHLYKTTASTMKKIADLPRYRHPGDLINIQSRPVRQQRLQINGQLQFNKKLYHSQAHEKLIKSLLQTRSVFNTSTLQNKNKIAGTQFNLWRHYLHERVASIPETQLIQGNKKQKVYQSFLIAKQRNQQKMQLSKTVKLFYQISLGFKFDLRIHPLVMMRMVYPYYGYLNNFKDQRLTFDQYVKFLEQVIAVSGIFYQGNMLHGYQLLSFVFWKAYANNHVMDIGEFCKFLGLFKFNVKPQNIKDQLGYHLSNKSRDGEIKQGQPVRFDLCRNIFLQRGL